MRILSVEDEEATATVMRMLLERELKASVDTAPDCATAREFLSSGSYDLVTLDHQLPDGDGLSLLQEIVEREGAPPVIIVTGHGDEQTAVSAFKLGASGYVVKDARMPTMLIEEARSALARAELKKSEEELKESEERYRTLFENMSEGFALCRMVYDDDGHPVDWVYLDTNKAYESLTGLRNVVGKRFTEVVPGINETNPELLETYGRVVSTGKPEHFEVRVEPLSIDLSITAFRPMKDQVAGVFENITDRKAAEKTLRESEEKLLSAQEIGRIGSWEYDVDSNQIEWSLETYRLYERDPALGAPTEKEEAEYYSEEQAQVLRQYAARAIAEGKDFEYDLEVRLSGGRRAFYSATLQPIKDDGGRVIRLWGTVQDITDRKEAGEALRRSEELYRKLVEASPDAIVVVDFEGNILAQSKNAKEITGYDEGDLSGTSVFALTPESYQDLLTNNLETLRETGQLAGSELGITRKDGTEVLVEVNASTIKDEDGNPSAIVAVVRDITERKAAESVLRESEQKFREFAENLPEVVAEADSLGRFAYMNANGFEAFGYTEEELYSGSINVLEMIAEEDRERAAQRMQKILSEGPQGSSEYMARRKDGSLFPVIISTLPVVRDGVTVGLRIVLTDVTAQKETEEALRDEREFVDTAINALQDGFYVLSVEGGGKLVRWNKMFNDVTGYSDEELSNMTIFDFFDEEGKKKQEQFFLELLEKGKASIEVEIITRDGRRIPYHGQSTMMRDDEGNPLYVCGVARDITERKRAEEALLRANAELDGFAHTIAHDLKGHLASMGIAIDLIKVMGERPVTDDTFADVGEALEIMVRSVDRATDLVDGLLALARAGQAPVEVTGVDVGRVLRSVLGEKSGVIEERRVEVTVDERLGTIRANEFQVYQVFSNLIGNAIKHNDSPEPAIEVRSLPAGEPGEHRYLVRDNGPGIPEGDLENIFLPFHKGANSKGTGIGLSIVDKVVRLYGGEMRAYNDDGACFEFTLPTRSP